MRIDTHHHLLPGIDDGCRDLADSIANIGLMKAAGYSRIFCTPHCFNGMNDKLYNVVIIDAVEKLRAELAAQKIDIEIMPGGEVTLVHDLCEQCKVKGLPTFGMGHKYVLVETWEITWPKWADAQIDWLQNQGLTVILAHPERMRPIHEHPELFNDLSRRGVLMQGTLNPIAGGDSPKAAELSERWLKEGRYFMVASDGHRPDTIPKRISGLDVIRKYAGEDELTRLTITNPGKVWNGQ